MEKVIRFESWSPSMFLAVLLPLLWIQVLNSVTVFGRTGLQLCSGWNLHKRTLGLLNCLYVPPFSTCLRENQYEQQKHR